jgi:spermidine synthase
MRETPDPAASRSAPGSAAGSAARSDQRDDLVEQLRPGGQGEPRQPLRRAAAHSATLLVFFVSGALALVYQVAWVRAITLQLGSTTLAVSTVVATFMGGLALGSAAAGRWGDWARRPLLVYALLEAGLSVYALATPLLIRTVLPALGDAAALTGDSMVLLSLFRLLVSALLLLPPTVLMGATLPVLARSWASTRDWRGQQGDGAFGTGLLYSANTLGAFAGTLVVGFLLLPTLGLRGTVLWTASLNLVVALVAALIDRAMPALAPAPAAPEPRHPRRRLRFAALPLAVGLTAFGALVCEVAWTRLIAMVSGGSVYAFTIVLAIFLAGLGLGAVAISLMTRSERFEPRRLFCVLAVWAAALVAISYLVALRLPAMFVDLFVWLAVDVHPERTVAITFLLVAAVLLPPTLAMGGLLPLAARLWVVSPERTSLQVSGIYVANTVGSVLGSLIAGYLLIPWVGIRGALAVAVCAQAAGALALALEDGQVDGRGSRLPRWLAGPIVITVVTMAQPWPAHLMASGVYDKAYLRRPATARQLALRVERDTELLYYRDGLTATVTVTRDRSSPNADLYISTDGKIDGSSHFDMPTQRLAAHLPLLLHPDPLQVGVIGLGTGCTAGSAALHPVKVTVVEIEPAMVEGARWFAEDNHGVVDDPEVTLRVTDGRLFLRLHPSQLDVVVSEPSNPWLAGTTDLFTREFFELAKGSLRSGGIFAQWLQIYGLAPETLRLLLRTFDDVFPYTYVASTLLDSDVLLLGSETSLDFDPARIQARTTESITADLADPRVDVHDVWSLLARVRLGPEEVVALADSGPLNTDDLPYVAYRAPLELFERTVTANRDLLESYDRHVVADALAAGDELRALLVEAWETFVASDR